MRIGCHDTTGVSHGDRTTAPRFAPRRTAVRSRRPPQRPPATASPTLKRRQRGRPAPPPAARPPGRPHPPPGGPPTWRCETPGRRSPGRRRRSRPPPPGWGGSATRPPRPHSGGGAGTGRRGWRGDGHRRRGRRGLGACAGVEQLSERHRRRRHQQLALERRGGDSGVGQGGELRRRQVTSARRRVDLGQLAQAPGRLQRLSGSGHAGARLASQVVRCAGVAFAAPDLGVGHAPGGQGLDGGQHVLGGRASATVPAPGTHGPTALAADGRQGRRGSREWRTPGSSTEAMTS